MPEKDKDKAKAEAVATPEPAPAEPMVETETVPGGRYIVNGELVDANGEPLKK